MKKFITLFLVAIFILGAFSFNFNKADAKTSYYKSAKSGKFTTKSYSSSHKSTTYKSYYK